MKAIQFEYHLAEISTKLIDSILPICVYAVVQWHTDIQLLSTYIQRSGARELSFLVSGRLYSLEGICSSRYANITETFGPSTRNQAARQRLPKLVLNQGSQYCNAATQKSCSVDGIPPLLLCLTETFIPPPGYVPSEL